MKTQSLEEVCSPSRNQRKFCVPGKSWEVAGPGLGVGMRWGEALEDHSENVHVLHTHQGKASKRGGGILGTSLGL